MSDDPRIAAAAMAWVGRSIWDPAEHHQHIWLEAAERAIAAADAVDPLRVGAAVPDEPAEFFEEDESTEKISAAWAAGEKDVTVAPTIDDMAAKMIPMPTITAFIDQNDFGSRSFCWLSDEDAEIAQREGYIWGVYDAFDTMRMGSDDPQPQDSGYVYLCRVIEANNDKTIGVHLRVEAAVKPYRQTFIVIPSAYGTTTTAVSS